MTDGVSVALRSTAEFAHRKLLPWLIIRKGNEIIHFALLARDCTCHGDKVWRGEEKVLRFSWHGS